MDFRPTEPRNTEAQASGSLVSGSSNLSVGWCSLAVGAAIGMVMGLWSFDGPVPFPDWIGGYGELSRRLLRLGHIALFGLGILNILFAQHLATFVLTVYAKRFATLCINFGNICLPLTLIAASVWHPLKYLTSIPATAVFLGLVICAFGALRNQGGQPPQKPDHRSKTEGSGS